MTLAKGEVDSGVGEQNAVSSIQTKLQGGDLQGLLDEQSNPEAQVAAFCLLQNRTRVRSLYERVKLAPRFDFSQLAFNLGMPDEDRNKLGENLSTLRSTEQRYLDVADEFASFPKEDPIPWVPLHERNEEFRNKWNEHYDNRSALEAEVTLLEHQTFLLLRASILRDSNVPQAFKLEIIEGFKTPFGYGLTQEFRSRYPYPQVSRDEDRLLAEIYQDPTTSDDLKQKIADVSVERMEFDPAAFDIIPRQDYAKCEINKERVFRVLFSGPYLSADLVRDQLAREFVPFRNPKKVATVWEFLREFGTILDGYLNIGSSNDFAEFVDSFDVVAPLVRRLATYGFKYDPYLVHNSGYKAWETVAAGKSGVTLLKQLSSNSERLFAALDNLRTEDPNFQYNWLRHTYIRTTNNVSVAETNPYVLIAQRLNLDNALLEEDIREKYYSGKGISLDQFLSNVPDDFKDSVYGYLIDRMNSDMWDALRHKDFGKARRLTQAATSLIVSDHVSDYTISLVGSLFLKNSINPSLDNLETAFQLLSKHADKISTDFSEKDQINPNNAWYRFIMAGADLYRYQLGSPNEVDQLHKAKRDLELSYQGLTKMQPGELKDKAATQLVLAYTDVDYADEARLQEVLDQITDVNVKEDALEEVRLEEERKRSGETNAWKRIEKVKRHSRESRDALIGLLQFGNEDDWRQAYKVYKKKVGYEPHNIQVGAGISPERPLQLENEVARIASQMGVTINLSWDSIKKSLEGGRFLSGWEVAGVFDERTETAKSMPLTPSDYDYGKRRDEVERLLDNRAKGGARDPHPLYGAASTVNGRDEFYGGVGMAWYGESFIKLKTDSIKERTTFVYDDSFNGFAKLPLAWEDAVYAKAIHNLLGHDSIHGYVEAQILGGVTIGDIEEVCVPRTIKDKEGKVRFQLTPDQIQDIDRTKQAFPNVRFTIIEKPQ